MKTRSERHTECFHSQEATWQTDELDLTDLVAALSFGVIVFLQEAQPHAILTEDQNAGESQ